jgi:hypothetical protein
MLKGDERAFQQHKQDPNKITKVAKEEWNKSDLQLANYTQYSDQRFLLKSPQDLSGPHIKLLKIQVCLSTFDS